MLNRYFTILFVTLGLSGCAAYSIVDADQPAPIGANLVVDPQVDWARMAYPTEFGSMWTIDGVGLNQLYFFTEIESGDPLIRGQGRDALPVYEETMIATDIVELISTTLTRMSFQQVATSNLRPAKFGPRDGFQFDLELTAPSGLIVNGLAVASQREDELDALVFLAPDEYYFDLHRQTVEGMFASIRSK